MRKINLIKTTTYTAAVIAVSLALSISSFAAVKQMPDGGTFDAEYYASAYMDVVASVGTDENALYNHYLQFGQAEGRKPYADAAVKPLPSVTDRILALKSRYPEGMTWGSDSSFTSSSTRPHYAQTATACQGFAYAIQDAVFGTRNYQYHDTGLSAYIRQKVGAGNGYELMQGNSEYVVKNKIYRSTDSDWSEIESVTKDHMWIPLYADGTRIYDGNDSTVNANFEAIWNSLKPGDMIIDASHSAVVVTKNDNGITIVEGNSVKTGTSEGRVVWGRYISKNTMRVALYAVLSCQW